VKKDWRERELTMEIIVGAFLVMIFLGLGYFTIILSKESLFQENYELKVSFEDVSGLRVGDNVFLRGMPVGKVTDLQIQCDTGCRGVLAIANLDMPVELREGYTIRIVPTSLLGGQQMQIEEGDLEGAIVQQDVYDGAPPYDIMGHASEIMSVAREQVVENDLFGRVNRIVAQVDEVVTRVNEGKGTLGKILSEEDTLYTDLTATMAGVRKIVDGLTAGEGIAGRLLAEEDEGALDDLSALLASLRVIVEKVERGEGTIGKLLTDEAVYAEIEASIEEVRAAVDDFRETAPITTFSSIFFGAF
jgi:phospholipid/cholesterol/gamma-HCH transport system substrate-binding protein